MYPISRRVGGQMITGERSRTGRAYVTTSKRHRRISSISVLSPEGFKRMTPTIPRVQTVGYSASDFKVLYDQDPAE